MFSLKYNNPKCESSSYLFLKNVSTMDVGISMAVKDVRCTRLFGFSNEPLWRDEKKWFNVYSCFS